MQKTETIECKEVLKPIQGPEMKSASQKLSHLRLKSQTPEFHNYINGKKDLEH